MIGQVPTEYNGMTSTHRVQWYDNYPQSTVIGQLPTEYNDMISTHISAGSIPGFVRYQSIPEFCSILDTYVVIKSNFHIEHSSQ